MGRRRDIKSSFIAEKLDIAVTAVLIDQFGPPLKRRVDIGPLVTRRDLDAEIAARVDPAVRRLVEELNA